MSNFILGCFVFASKGIALFAFLAAYLQNSRIYIAFLTD